MYKCNDCQMVFDMPEYESFSINHHELAGMLGPTDEHYQVEHCPYCGGTVLLDVWECPACGEWTEDEYCPECMEKATQSVEGLQKAMGLDWKTAVDLVCCWAERN